MTYPKGWLGRAALLNRRPMPLKTVLRVVKEAEGCSADEAADLVDAFIASGALERSDDGQYHAIPGGG